VDSPLDPPRVRAVVFEEARVDARFDRVAALQRAARSLEASADVVERALFADRPCRRRIDAPVHTLSAAAAVEAYNLALVQGLLLRCEHVTVQVREHVRAVVRFAKLAGLLCTYALGDRATQLEISGPLSALRRTTKYGRALASFVPAVLATTGFRIEARCILARGASVHVHIDAADRIARTHALPKDADSAVERALARDVRRMGGDWTLVREADAVHVGHGRAFFPDFTLRHADGFAALVEIVGFYTPEYLRSKLEALRAAASRPMIVCVDESLARAEGDVPGAVLRFRRRVDAPSLLAAAERLRRG
jgi:predicted nuclease of restriction endonuclease-like RecB superfamily